MKLLKLFLYALTIFETRRLRQLRNIHSGQQCNIIGDGISLKWFNLTFFPPVTTFSLGNLPFHVEASRINLNYINLGDSWWLYPFFILPKGLKPNSFLNHKRIWRNRINKMFKEYFKEHPEKRYFSHISNYPYTNKPNTYHFFRKINDPHFSFANECISKKRNPLEGSLTRSITLAIYMGFKKITLIGCDYTHEISRSHHWFEKGEGVIFSHPNYQREFFEIAQKYVEIFTVTLEGEGSILPSITYKNLTGKPLAYRENTELADTETLRLLSSWPDYTIF